jgi:REP element-mobilizing transposase RayT
MPRNARLDAPGVLHHVMGRGLDRQSIFRDEHDQDDFVRRLAGLAEAGALTIYAWALLPNHFHLLVRTGTRPLARSMRSLLTGTRAPSTDATNGRGICSRTATSPSS